MQNSVSFNDDWQQFPFSQCIDKISIKHKVKQKEYLDSGKYPVIDQAQKFISGYCNDEIVVKITKPIIVFGDHTRCFKFVDFDFVAGADGIHILQPKDFFNEKLFYYFCLALDFPNKGYSRHYQYLAKTMMRIPPLEIQRRIVKRLDEVFARIENGTKHLQSAKDNLTKYKQSLLKSAFNGTLTQDCHADKSVRNDESANLPQGWTIKTLGEIGEIVSGGTPTTSQADNFGGDIAWITPADLSNHNDKFISQGKRNISEKGLKNSSARLVPKGTILFSSRAPIGYVAIASNPLCTNQGFKSLIPNENVFSEFVYYYLLNSKNLAESYASGTTFKEISAKSFSKLPIPIPSLETQKQIVAILEKHFTSADKVSAYINSCLTKAKQLKSSMLKSSFSGELV